MAGAGAGATIRCDLGPSRRTASAVGVGEDPDVAEGRTASVAAKYGQSICGRVVNRACALPRAGSGAGGSKLSPRQRAGDSVGIAQHPHIIEVVGRAIVSAEDDERISGWVVRAVVMSTSRGQCTRNGLGNPGGLGSGKIVGARHHEIVVGAGSGKAFLAAEEHHAIVRAVVECNVAAAVGGMRAFHSDRRPTQIIAADGVVELPVVTEIGVGERVLAAENKHAATRPGASADSVGFAENEGVVVTRKLVGAARSGKNVHGVCRGVVGSAVVSQRRRGAGGRELGPGGSAADSVGEGKNPSVG